MALFTGVNTKVQFPYYETAADREYEEYRQHENKWAAEETYETILAEYQHNRDMLLWQMADAWGNGSDLDLERLPYITDRQLWFVERRRQETWERLVQLEAGFVDR